MLFKVEMTVIPPAHLSEDEFNAIKLKEKKYLISILNILIMH